MIHPPTRERYDAPRSMPESVQGSQGVPGKAPDTDLFKKWLTLKESRLDYDMSKSWHVMMDTVRTALQQLITRVKKLEVDEIKMVSRSNHIEERVSNIEDIVDGLLDTLNAGDGVKPETTPSGKVMIDLLTKNTSTYAKLLMLIGLIRDAPKHIDKFGAEGRLWYDQLLEKSSELLDRDPVEGMPGVEFEGPMGKFWPLDEVPSASLLKGMKDLLNEATRRGWKEDAIIEYLKKVE